MIIQWKQNLLSISPRIQRLYRINLLQCRPVQTRGQAQRVKIPVDVDQKNVFIFLEGQFMGGSVVQDIGRVIFIDPIAYSRLPLSDKYSIARLIGRLNKLIKNRDETPTMLLGPGRWGTTTPSLGVPVRFSEINNVTFLGEIAYTDGNLMPELSFGTHFFQDLVETNIFYLAIFPDNPEVVFPPELSSLGLKMCSKRLCREIRNIKML